MTELRLVGPDGVPKPTSTEARDAIIDNIVDRLELARIGYETALDEVARVRAEGDLTFDEQLLADYAATAAIGGLAKADAAFELAKRVAS